MPVFRVRKHEMEVLRAFDFGRRMCPYIEIVKEKDRPRKMSSSLLYRSVIHGIKSNTVFVDIPVQFRLDSKKDKEVIEFLTPMQNVDYRIRTLISFASLQQVEKMVPVISSYHKITSETGSIKKQADKLRPTFPRLAFRVTAKDPEFESELDQVESHLTAEDHLIVDFEEDAVNLESDHIKELIVRLSKITICPIVVFRSAIPNSIKYKDLQDDEEVPGADNGLLRKYKTLGASAFGDYAGIKKDLLPNGGGSDKITYGCIYYDGTNNQYYGYKASQPGYAAVKDSVIPSVINSQASERMLESSMQYLNNENRGWKLLQDEKTGTPGDIKRVSMEHYLHCIRTKVEAGHFN